MRNSIIIFSAAVLAVLLAAGCNNDFDNFDEGDFFYVRHDGADLPVWICGYVASKVFVIHLNGGPGGSSIVYHAWGPIRDLESQYAQVYWDQRCSGQAQGNSAIEQLNVDQFVEDTDTIVDAVRLKYDNPRIFLMGISWGGGLGTAYLLDPERQAKISGWIEVDGSHDIVWGMQLSRQYVLDYADSIISGAASPEEDVKKWTEIIEWYAANPEININNIDTHAGYVEDAYGYVPEGRDDGMDDLMTAGNILFTRIHFTMYMQNSDFNQKYFDIYHLNLVPQMDSIVIPTLIIWGAHDGILPAPLAREAYDAIGTPGPDKYLVILPNSGHTPVLADIDLFSNTLTAFIENYRI